MSVWNTNPDPLFLYPEHTVKTVIENGNDGKCKCSQFVIKLCSKTDIARVDLKSGACDNYGTVNCESVQHC